MFDLNYNQFKMNLKILLGDEFWFKHREYIRNIPLLHPEEFEEWIDLFVAN